MVLQNNSLEVGYRQRGQGGWEQKCVEQVGE